MKNLSKLLAMRLSPQVPISLIVLILIVALIGFADAIYLTIEHYQGAIPPCSVVSGCEKVLTSAYSIVAGIPVSLLGSLYYLIISIGLFTYLDTKKSDILKWTLSLTVFGLFMSLWFIFVQAVLLHAWCLYCLGSATSSIILFILANVVFGKYGECSKDEN